MLRYCVAVLLGLTGTSADDVPLSKQGEGYYSSQFMLKRDMTQKPGYFYYPMTIHGEDFDMQVTSFDNIVGIVSDKCLESKCSGMKKLVSREIIERDKTVERNFKDTKDQKQNEQGFYYEAFLGNFVGNKADIIDSNKRTQMLVDFPIFQIEKPSKMKDVFTSKQSGVIGFGPSTYNNDVDKKHNVVYAMRGEGDIKKETVTYNITMNDNVNSYIQIGGVSDLVQRNTTFQYAESFDHYGQLVTSSLFQMTNSPDGKLLPFSEFNAKAIFDPQVDYMYVNSFEFGEFIAPQLYIAYGFGESNGFDCDKKKCWWKAPCSQVKKVGMVLKFKLGLKIQEAVDIEINPEDFLVDSANLGIKEKNDAQFCYYPIFVADAAQRKDVFNAWFLGNMFLDKYLVIHDQEDSRVTNDVDTRRFPRIGIYDKKNPKEYKPFGPDDKPDPQKVDPSGGDSKGGKDAVSDGGLGAGWVFLIILLILAGCGGIYMVFGAQIKEKLAGGGTGTFSQGQV